MDVFFFLEEESMKVMLEIILPKIMPGHISYRLISFNGKSELQSSLPKKLRAIVASYPDARFVVVQDKDRADCAVLKNKLKDICRGAGAEHTLVRIVCNELENWLLGDLDAIERAYSLSGFAEANVNTRKFRNIDGMTNSSQEIRRLVSAYSGKVAGARAIATHMEINRNRSHSFCVFVSGIRRLLELEEVC